MFQKCPKYDGPRIDVDTVVEDSTRDGVNWWD